MYEWQNQLQTLKHLRQKPNKPVRDKEVQFR